MRTRDLDAIGPAGLWLEGVPPGKIAHFAGEAGVTDVADLRKVTTEEKRLTLIVRLAHTVRAGVRDDVVTMFCKRMAAIHKKGRDHLEALREAQESWRGQLPRHRTGPAGAPAPRSQRSFPPLRPPPALQRARAGARPPGSSPSGVTMLTFTDCHIPGTVADVQLPPRPCGRQS